MVRLELCTPHGGYSARHTRHQLCGGLRGSSGCPREVTFENERFDTISFHVHLQQAIVMRRQVTRCAERHGFRGSVGAGGPKVGDGPRRAQPCCARRASASWILDYITHSG